MQNTFRVNGTMSGENGILMGECPVCKLGWFGIVVAGRQKTISVGRENYLLLPSYCQYIAVRIRKERKKIPEQVVKRATALTLQQQLQSVLLSGKRKTVYMGKKAMFFLYHHGMTSFSEIVLKHPFSCLSHLDFSVFQDFTDCQILKNNHDIF